MVTEIFRVCVAYEQGVGHAERAELSNPYHTGTPEHEAWDYGRESGHFGAAEGLMLSLYRVRDELRALEEAYGKWYYFKATHPEWGRSYDDICRQLACVEYALDELEGRPVDPEDLFPEDEDGDDSA